jgi:preprotein translocase subunit SecD
VNQYRTLYALESKAIITGENLVDASAAIDPLTNGPTVRFKLDRAGGQRFGNETGQHVGDFLAVVVDGRVQERPLVIQGRIDGNWEFPLGNRSLQEAQDLALMLRAGALPLPLRIVAEERLPRSPSRNP